MFLGLCNPREEPKRSTKCGCEHLLCTLSSWYMSEYAFCSASRVGFCNCNVFTATSRPAHHQHTILSCHDNVIVSSHNQPRTVRSRHR